MINKPINYKITEMSTETMVDISNLTEKIVTTVPTPVELQSKEITPMARQSIDITADAGYDGLSNVLVKEIPYSEVSNLFGTTCIIGG